MKTLNSEQSHPSSLGSTHIGGGVAERLERFAYERITSEVAHTVVFHEAEDAFRNQLDDSSGIYGIWQGEFWGKWVIGAVRYCEYSADEELKDFIRRSVDTLIGMQEPSGYIGTYRDPMNVFAADTKRSEPIMGWACDWNWNIWCRKYTLWGLIEAHRLLGDEHILQAAEKLALHLIHSLHERDIRLGSTGTFEGIPSGSILKPMVLLYRVTQKETYLNFAREIAEDWKREDGQSPNLITNALSMKPVHKWYPEPEKWAKAYELMSCFDGIIELYRVTGESELLESAICFHALLKRYEYNAVLSVGFNDMFNNASSQVSAISEPCDVIHWMRLCGELYLETGNYAYLDDFELAFYNPFLAGVCQDGKWGARGVRSHSRHFYVFEQAGMKHNHCCVNNVPRGFLNFVQLAATANEHGVSVNFYSPFETTLVHSGGQVKLSVSGDYLGNGEVKVVWESNIDEDVNLRLRIPGWATGASIDRSDASKHVGWFELPLRSGKSQATLSFDRGLKITRYDAPYEIPEWYQVRWHEEFFRTEAGCTLQYGPLLLARSKLLGNSEEEIFGPPLPTDFTCSLTQVPSDAVAFAYKAEIKNGERRLQTKLCDYASAGNFISEDQKLFSIFI